MSTAEASASPSAAPAPKQPVVILIVGMAGTGKTTLVHRLQNYAEERAIRSYFINLDPAVTTVPYKVNIDIRDTVDYKEVMRGYRLGPNGAILTSLNLFATKFHQVVALLEEKQGLEWIVVDTPGQIEVFTWSASGQLISEALGATFPTVVLFVADTTRCLSPQTFVSTMLYSSGIMLKQQLPLIIVFNKTDVVSADVPIGWMRNTDALQDAVTSENNGGGGGDDAAPSGLFMSSGGGGGDGGSATGYASTLARSMSLFLHDFYEDIPYAAVSAASGAGMEQLQQAVETAKAEAMADAARANEEGKLREERRAEKQQRALARDLKIDEDQS